MVPQQLNVKEEIQKVDNERTARREYCRERSKTFINKTDFIKHTLSLKSIQTTGKFIDMLLLMLNFLFH